MAPPAESSAPRQRTSDKADKQGRDEAESKPEPAATKKSVAAKKPAAKPVVRSKPAAKKAAPKKTVRKR